MKFKVLEESKLKETVEGPDIYTVVASLLAKLTSIDDAGKVKCDYDKNLTTALIRMPNKTYVVRVSEM